MFRFSGIHYLPIGRRRARLLTPKISFIPNRAIPVVVVTADARAIVSERRFGRGGVEDEGSMGGGAGFSVICLDHQCPFIC
jgi:hypothetical protein